ncbi:iron export ABC transporter permease subunit FetB [Membranicola marinus]|uniref:Iron export ABC transporter permease subunit FetB n=1 Tax=Membranihabitans marinus TaxID=1227546 RepID=A0A953LA64_9BACT|nr:iron export ABC transporter permease subunit FetB [Membranihabitans marinus]MBY5959595.1 iron export ABC transporter permease subunit FetB [Membranihabitans marinus]
MDIIDLTWGQLAIGFGILIIPGLILWKYKTGLLQKMGIAVVRMTLQLIFVGYYLEYLFEYDNPWVNLAWIMIMVIVADFATINRSGLRRSKKLFISIFIATFLGVVIIDLFFLTFVIRLPNIMAAQYTIPITGMVLGNCLRSNVIGMNEFYYSIDQHQERYRFYLANGATQEEALFPFFRTALRKSANPNLAAMATIGLVALPGMMTGQILSGSSPLIAIKYQIMIMIAIFSGTVLSVYLGISISRKFTFDSRGRFDHSMLKKD